MSFFELIKFLSLILISASISATLLVVFYKWKLDELYQVRRPSWMPAEVCDFCLGFWFSWPLVVYQICQTSDFSYLAVPFGAASIAKTLYNLARSKNR